MAEDRQADSRAELEAYLNAHPQTASLDALFIDLCGQVRGKRYPREDLGKLFEEGLQIPYSLYLLDATGESLDPCGRGFSDGDPDGTAVVLPGTLASVPWAETPRAQVLMTMHDEAGRPSSADPRNVAADSLARIAELGLRPVVAFELEFYLLDPRRDRQGRPQAPRAETHGRRRKAGQVYAIDGLDEFPSFFADVEAMSRAQGVPATVATKEYGHGQFEINLRHQDDALRAADHCALLRHLVRSVAARNGLDATFMSKPFAEQTGNGMHVHVSLLDDAGRNVFDDGSATGSERLRHAVGGLAATLPEAMAIFAPNINAFRRFGPNLFVPVTKSWGSNNRSFAFRIPCGSGSARRIEHRVAGAEANPYLVLAALLAGLHHGTSGRLDPGPAWSGNASETVDPDIPADLPAALARTRDAQVLCDYFKDDYLTLYCAAKDLEYRRFLSEITTREYDWYL